MAALLGKLSMPGSDYSVEKEPGQIKAILDHDEETRLDALGHADGSLGSESHDPNLKESI